MANIQEEPQAPDLNRQPNWEILFQSLWNITDEATLIHNVPAFNQGNHVLQGLDRLMHDVAELQGQATLRQGMNALEREQATSKERQDTFGQHLNVLNHQLAALPLVMLGLRDEICRQ